MLRNYFKLAIKVLGRRKFFTFISLFGISFTLMILMLVVAFLDAELGDHAPMTKMDQMVFLPQVKLKYESLDTIMQVDSTLMDGIYNYDTTYSYENRNQSISISSGGFKLFDNYFRSIPSAVNYSFYSPRHNYDIFKNSNKLTFSGLYADSRFWQIFDFEFLEGGPFTEQAVNNQEQVLILTHEAAADYFGSSTNIVGKEVFMDNKNFRVIGVLAPMVSQKPYLEAEVYIPYTNLPARMIEDPDFHGTFEAVFLAKSPDQKTQIKSEINQKASLIPLPNPDEYNQLELNPMDFMERYAVMIRNDEDPQSSLKFVFGALIGLLILFFLLPTLNLINLNTSRILERSAEIGVRKAFGAEASHILFQFVFENIILTFIGGIIGFIFALILLGIINNSKILPDTILQFNIPVFIYSLLITLFFGILSGFLPAFRMSKIHIVKAIKQNQI